MSYLLTGGPGRGQHLLSWAGREVTRRCLPCLCISCNRLLISDTQSIANSVKPVVFQNQSMNSTIKKSLFPLSEDRLGRDIYTNEDDSNKNNDELYNQAKSNVSFTHKYFTNLSTSHPQIISPINVNLALVIGPEVSTGVSYRYFHTSSNFQRKSSSKVEETVDRLKERLKQSETLSELSEVEDLEKKIQSVVEEEDLAVKVSNDNKKAAAPPDNRTLWQKVAAEAKHYYSGFKLLFLDVKVSSKIIWRVLNGKTLSRRENRQLVRTVSDLFRLVPFSVFILVPFMELLLPVALKLFPGMLPSTFTSQDERENKMRRGMKAKLEYARFLQKTLDDMGPMDKGHRSQSAAEFVEFYETVKKSGGAVNSGINNKDILKFSKLFSDNVTLDSMSRGQLVAICRLLDLTPIGTNAFLKFQIEMQLRKLKADDLMISKEGIDQMSVAELQVACKERGMRALGMTREKLTMQLKQWIELSTNEQVPPSLLLLSRTLYLPDSLAPEKAIEATISALPEAAATEAKAKIGEKEGKIENVTRLEIIKQEQAKIEEEQKEKKKIKEEKIRKLEVEKVKQDIPAPSIDGIVREASGVLQRATVSQEGDLSLATPDPSVTINNLVVTVSDDIHVGSADVLQESTPATTKAVSATIEEDLSKDDWAALTSAIETIAAEKGQTYIMDHQVLGQLRQELTDYQQDVGEMKEVAEISGRKNLKQGKGAARLFKKVNNMLGKVDSVVVNLESQEKKLASDISSLQGAGENTAVKEGQLVTVHELLGAVNSLQKVPDSNMLERISEVVASMDKDSDGVIKLEHVKKVIEILGEDGVQSSSKHVKHVMELISKEEMLDMEKKIEKIMDKLPKLDISTDITIKDTPAESAKEDVVVLDSKYLLVDKAEELNDQQVEEHIVEMFSRTVVDKETTEVNPPDADIELSSQTLVRQRRNNAVKTVTEDESKDKKVGLENYPKKNGST